MDLKQELQSLQEDLWRNNHNPKLLTQKVAKDTLEKWQGQGKLTEQLLGYLLKNPTFPNSSHTRPVFKALFKSNIPLSKKLILSNFQTPEAIHGYFYDGLKDSKRSNLLPFPVVEKALRSSTASFSTASTNDRLLVYLIEHSTSPKELTALYRLVKDYTTKTDHFEFLLSDLINNPYISEELQTTLFKNGVYFSFVYSPNRRTVTEKQKQILLKEIHSPRPPNPNFRSSKSPDLIFEILVNYKLLSEKELLALSNTTNISKFSYDYLRPSFVRYLLMHDKELTADALQRLAWNGRKLSFNNLLRLYDRFCQNRNLRDDLPGLVSKIVARPEFKKALRQYHITFTSLSSANHKINEQLVKKLTSKLQASIS